MPYNGSGSFSAPSASFPAVSGALIESAKYNNVVNDIASGLSNAITKDGQTTVTANLPMAGFRFTGVGDAVSLTDYASAKQVQNSSMLWAGAAGGTADAITLTLTPAPTAYAAGQSFTYKSGASANTGAMTANINGLGAKAIQKNGAALVAGDHAAGKWFRITYDGAAFQLERFGAVGLTGDETVAGVKTFSSSPIVPTPSAGTNDTSTASTAFVLANNISIDGSGVTLSGTSAELSGSIPTWVKRITLLFNAVSTTGTSNVLVQVGDSGGYETTSYGSESLAIETTTPSIATSTSGFVVNVKAASSLLAGRMVLERTSGSATTWIESHVFRAEPSKVLMGAGSKALSAALDRIRVTTVSGTDTFDGGSITLLFE